MIDGALPRSFYDRSTIDVAKGLLGKVLRHNDTAGIIVETEAYLGGDDLASHSARGLTPRTKVIFGPPGHAYVYLIYGMYECLNVVTEAEGQPGCVLLRALEPYQGHSIMRDRRPAARKDRDLASGPGKLARALAIGRECNGADLTAGDLTIDAHGSRVGFEIGISPRVGITHCADWALRFYIRDNLFVSRR